MKRIIIELADDIQVDMVGLAPLMASASKFQIDVVSDRVEATRTRGHVNRPGSGMTAPGEIMSHFSPDAVFQGSAAGSWCMAKGYSRTTASAALSLLSSKGYIRSLGAGKYQFVKPFEPGVKLQGKGS